LNYHSEIATNAWTLDAYVFTAARPGASELGFLQNDSSSDVALGTMTYNPVIITKCQAPDFACVRGEITALLGGASGGIRYLALGANHAVYEKGGYSNTAAWIPYFPPSIKVGTVWQSSLVGSGYIGQAFAYRSVGNVSYRPRFRTAAGSTPPGSDANLVSIRVPVTTANVTTAAIDYQTGGGYIGPELRSNASAN
jgi:hypothetical protein